jgi:electron transport complex protein RnfC
MLEYTPDRRLTGGLRLKAEKARSTGRPIKRGLLPTRLILSLAQHRSPPAKPRVAVGQRVLRGEVVAVASSVLGANVHASTSGVVHGIGESPVPTLAGVEMAPTILIEADGKHESVDFSANLPWPAVRNTQLARLRDGGIVGLGGAGYPTAAKLGAVRPCRILVINGAECEPYISCDDMLMREAPEQILAGARIIAELLGAAQCIVAIERDKALAVDAIGQAVQPEGEPPLRLAELPSIYPAGGERQLIEVLTGEEVPAHRYPSDLGFACQNVGTAYAVYRLAAYGEPLMTRIVTVTGQGVAAPQNVEVPIGTPIAELIEFCGGYREGVRRLVHGGTMMGYALPSDALPVTKGTNCIIAATAEEVREDYTEWPCIRCGECASACPVRLQPQDLLIAARASDHSELDALGLDECIECGCCDVACPSHIPLTETFRQAKNAHSLHEELSKFSAQSEQRYLRREERNRNDAESGKRMQEELRHGLESEESAKAAIEAAVARARSKRGPSKED